MKSRPFSSRENSSVPLSLFRRTFGTFHLQAERPQWPLYVPLGLAFFGCLRHQLVIRRRLGLVSQQTLGGTTVSVFVTWSVREAHTTATKTRREKPRAVKMSLKDNRIVTKPACIAGVLVSRPNRNARCGRTKL